ncbi:MAG: histidine--tRNA ligase, partial [Nanoarchaeota archaeon]
QGGRDLGLRFEFTFALARYIAMNPQTKMPFKRYQMGPVFRDGPIKSGRYREFWQCDVDIVGSKKTMADAEIVLLADAVFKALDLAVAIEINNRKLLYEMMAYAGIAEEQQTSAIIIVDKLKKMGRDGVAQELKEKGLADGQIEKLMELLMLTGSNADMLKALQEKLPDSVGLSELEELFGWLDAAGVTYTFLPSLARGLGYYTGPIFEVFLTDEKLMSSSIAGGGRWDEMVGQYIGNPKMATPAVGISFGIEPIMEILKQKEGLEQQTTARFFIIPMGTEKKSLTIAQRLRSQGLRVAIDLNGRNMKKNLNYVNKLNIPYAIIIGQDELDAEKIKLKDMKSGDEQLIPVDEVQNWA